MVQDTSKISTRTVFTDGVFDLIHANHVSFLEEAATFGDRLVVAVVSDAQAQTFKRLPVICEQERLCMVRALSCVDLAFVLNEPLVAETMEQLIDQYRVSSVVYSGNATPEFYLPAEKAGIMHRLAYRSGTCSTGIINRIVDQFGNPE